MSLNLAHNLVQSSLLAGMQTGSEEAAAAPDEIIVAIDLDAAGIGDIRKPVASSSLNEASDDRTMVERFEKRAGQGSDIARAIDESPVEFARGLHTGLKEGAAAALDLALSWALSVTAMALQKIGAVYASSQEFARAPLGEMLNLSALVHEPDTDAFRAVVASTAFPPSVKLGVEMMAKPQAVREHLRSTLAVLLEMPKLRQRLLATAASDLPWIAANSGTPQVSTPEGVGEWTGTAVGQVVAAAAASLAGRVVRIPSSFGSAVVRSAAVSGLNEWLLTVAPVVGRMRQRFTDAGVRGRLLTSTVEINVAVRLATHTLRDIRSSVDQAGRFADVERFQRSFNQAALLVHPDASAYAATLGAQPIIHPRYLQRFPDEWRQIGWSVEDDIQSVLVPTDPLHGYPSPYDSGMEPGTMGLAVYSPGFGEWLTKQRMEAEIEQALSAVTGPTVFDVIDAHRDWFNNRFLLGAGGTNAGLTGAHKGVLDLILLELDRLRLDLGGSPDNPIGVSIGQHCPAELRAFEPNSERDGNKTGRVTLRAAVTNAPADAKLRWSLDPPAAARFSASESLTTEVIAASRTVFGRSMLRFDVLDDQDRVVATDRSELCVPPHFVVRDSDELTTAFETYRLEGLEERFVTIQREWALEFLRGANVRIIWDVAPLRESVQLDEAAYTPVTLTDIDPTADGTWGVHEPADDRIRIFVGVIRATTAEDWAIAYRNIAVAMVSSTGAERNRLRELWLQIVARAMGWTLAHEILHVIIRRRFATEDNGASYGSYHNSNGWDIMATYVQQVRDLTGIEIIDFDAFPAVGSYVDHGFIAAIGALDETRTLIDRLVPVPPQFR